MGLLPRSGLKTASGARTVTARLLTFGECEVLELCPEETSERSEEEASLRASEPTVGILDSMIDFIKGAGITSAPLSGAPEKKEELPSNLRPCHFFLHGRMHHRPVVTLKVAHIAGAKPRITHPFIWNRSKA